jgi:hypothetical protein
MTTDAKTLNELPDDLRDKVLRFVTAASLVELDSDGVPCRPKQASEWDHLTDNANYFVAELRSPVGTPLGSVRHLAWQWQCVIAAFRHGGATDSNRRIMGGRWLAARAQVSGELFPNAPVADVSFSDETELPFNDPRVQKMMAEDPRLVGFIGQALAADVEPPCEP